MPTDILDYTVAKVKNGSDNCSFLVLTTLLQRKAKFSILLGSGHWLKATFSKAPMIPDNAFSFKSHMDINFIPRIPI